MALPNGLALIGNGRSAALINPIGSIEWCSMPYLDSPAHFGSLPPTSGQESPPGRFQIAPLGDSHSQQRYLDRSLVLETEFETPTGKGIVRDWIPTDRETPRIERQVEVLDGNVTWTLTCAPRFLRGTQTATAERSHRGFLFRDPGHETLIELRSQVPLQISTQGSSVQGRFALNAGESTQFSWIWGRNHEPAEAHSQDATLAFWRSWCHQCAPNCIFAGPWHDLVLRSEMVLRALYADYSGAVADSSHIYPACKVNQTAITVQALTALGHQLEAQQLFSWISDLTIRDRAENFQSLYTLDGGRRLQGRDVPFQLDVFGQTLLTASQYFRENRKLPDLLWPALIEIADYVSQAWRRPDHGFEGRGSRAEHFVLSKIMCWVALENASTLAGQLRHEVPRRWLEQREILEKTILSQGYDNQKQSFTRAFGDREVDPLAVMIPWVGFLPMDDPRVQGTLSTIQNELSDGVFILKSRDGERSPSLSLWLVSCLALSGQVDEAVDRLAEICSHAAPLGTVEDAETSLALINAAFYVGMARGRQQVSWVPLPLRAA